MTGRRYSYRVYGFAIESDFELAELEEAIAGVPQLRINSVPLSAAPGSAGGFRDYRVVPEGDLIEFKGVGRFLVRDGNSIDVDLDPSFDRRLAGLPLLGPVFSLLLHRRGLLVLHGSAVIIDGEAHVFLGDKGAGKSTTAAALVASGCPLVSDDVVAIERLPCGSLAVLPGYPAMKLDRGMLARFDSDTYRVLAPDEGEYTAGKLRVRFCRNVPGRPVPLGRIHCLARGRENTIEPLPAGGRLHALIRFSHYPRLGSSAMIPAETAHLFRLAARRAPEIEVDTLVVKHDLAELGNLRSFLTPASADVRSFA